MSSYIFSAFFLVNTPITQLPPRQLGVGFSINQSHEKNIANRFPDVLIHVGYVWCDYNKIHQNNQQDGFIGREQQQHNRCSARCPMQVGFNSRRQDLDMGCTLFKKVQGGRIPSLRIKVGWCKWVKNHLG